MKVLKASSLVLFIIVTFSLVTVPVKAEDPTLAEQLYTTLNTVNWSSPTSFIVPHFGLIFARESNYDGALVAIPDFRTLLQMKRIAEIDGFNSSLLNQTVAEALENQQMTGHWPDIDEDGVLVYWRFMVFAYRYADELGVDTSKWNMTLAFQEYLDCWQNDIDFLWFNPADGTSTDYSNRYYDENAQVLSIFLKFYQEGVPEAVYYANQMWAHLCTSHWSGSYFPYKGTSGQVECEAGHFAETIAELYAANGYYLPNFPSYVLQDLNYKFISGGDWSGRLWSPGAYVVRHAESNPEKRLENTVTAWAAMHSYYAVMNDIMKSNFVKLLTGSPTAWQGLINSSNLYSEGRFRWRENHGYMDSATCGGAMILFLNGIVPDSGSLAIPVIDEVYQDWYSMFPASHFRFDYESQTIRIPVWAGKVNFTFGSEPTSYNFTDNGIYEVQFSADWNNVTNATKISPLNEQNSYLPPGDPQTPEPQPTPTPTPSPTPIQVFPQTIPTIYSSPRLDTRAPTIVIASPKNKTYSDADVPLTFTVSESTSLISYSIDGEANVEVSGETILPRLPDGGHSIVVYATDSAGNVGASDIIHFTVDTTTPSISLLSPQNQTYATTEVMLHFTLNENASWTGYTLDGQENVTVTGNISLTEMAYGSHRITVYANDTYGNMAASETVYFSVSKPFPVMWTGALTAIIAGGGVVLLLRFKRNNKVKKRTNR